MVFEFLHRTKVVDLEAIHEHFKVCLVDPPPPGGGGSSRNPRGQGALPKSGDQIGQQQQEAPKKRRMVGTSVKSGRSGSRAPKPAASPAAAQQTSHRLPGTASDAAGR